ncbi:response regulator [Bacillus solimangrovi]|uniref:Response regulatory domain-containing protein n=1 Tax=Bacillus solimangrovi TaxID=1305675 RepID=A0A1E5LBU4_9BACI|nr:response regulator [Bacillus solimangrovi]OEH91550.1 hypothetical protein BFG57_18170 [Bacillus solimangrovi]
MIKVLLVDDEEAGLNLLNMLLSDFEEVEVRGQYTDPMKALEHLKVEQVDAVFLDIEMPQLSGMEVARKVKELNEFTKIVFVTAHMNFAVEAFEIESTDYLLKPVTKSRLDQSVKRLLKITNKPLKHDLSISVRCFGSFDIVNHDSSLLFNWRTNKVKELCAYLVHHEGRVVESEQIIEILWPEVDINKAKTSLYTCMSYLRQAFKKNGLKNIILRKSGGYFIDLSKINCDLIEWTRQINSLKPISTENIKQYEQLMERYSEMYMERMGFFWAEEKRAFISNKMISVFYHLGEFYRKNGELKKSLKCIEKELEYSCYSDEICQRLITTHLKMGNRSEALKVYRSFESNLQEDLGIEPSFQTKMVIQRINNQER